MLGMQTSTCGWLREPLARTAESSRRLWMPGRGPGATSTRHRSSFPFPVPAICRKGKYARPRSWVLCRLYVEAHLAEHDILGRGYRFCVTTLLLDWPTLTPNRVLYQFHSTDYWAHVKDCMRKGSKAATAAYDQLSREGVPYSVTRLGIDRKLLTAKDILDDEVLNRSLK